MNITILAILAILTFVLHSRTRKQPLHPDSGFYLYIPFFKNTGYKFSPSKVISLSPNKLTGDYNILDTKFLLRLFIHVTMYFDRSIKSFRLFYAFYNLLTGLAIFVLASLIGSPFFATVAASIYWIMSLSPYHDSFQLHAEQYAFLPMILAVVAIITACSGETVHVFTLDRVVLFFVSGFLLSAVIVCLKISYVVEIFTIFCLTAFWGVGIWNMIIMVLGACLLMLFTLLCSYFKTGSLDLFKYAYSPRSHIYYKNSMPAEGNIFKYNLKTYFNIFSCFLGGMFCFLVGIIYSFINHDMNILCLSILPFASLINIYYQKKFFMSHFYSLLPFSSLVAAYGVVQMLEYKGVLFPIAVISLILLLAPAMLQIIQYYIRYDALSFHIKISQIIRQKKILNFVAEEGIAEYINHNTDNDDYILQWGYNHEFYVLAKRRASLSGHLAATLVTDPQLNDAQLPNWRQCVLSDIEKIVPKYIVDFDGSLNIEFVNDITGHHYDLDKHFYGIYPLYRLVNAHCSEKKAATTDSLTSLTGNATERNINNTIFRSNCDFIQFVNGLLMKDNIKEADTYTKNGISNMCIDWRRINKEEKTGQEYWNKD